MKHAEPADTEGAVEVRRLLDKGMSINEIAIAIHRDWYTVYRWLKGKQNPDAAAISALRGM